MGTSAREKSCTIQTQRGTLRVLLHTAPDGTGKLRAIRKYLSDEKNKRGVIFCNTAFRAAALAAAIARQGRDAGTDGGQAVTLAVTGKAFPKEVLNPQFLLYYHLPADAKTLLAEAAACAADADCIFYLLPREMRQAERLLLAAEKLAATPAIDPAEIVLYRNASTLLRRMRRGERKADAEGLQRTTTAGDAICHLSGPLLTYFDFLVADAVYTLMRKGKKNIYARHVMELLSGNPELTLRPEKKAAVEQSLTKLSETNLFFTRSSGEKYTGAFVPLAKKKTGFALTGEELPLYRLAEETETLLSVPAAVLPVKDLPTSKENIELLHYIYEERARGRAHVRVEKAMQVLQMEMPVGAYYVQRKKDTVAEKIKLIEEQF